MNDPIDDAFASLDALYPGSKRTRRSAVESKKPAFEPTANWDQRPYQKVLNGKTQELFAIGGLAAALGRPLVTIRLWIREGKLPQATYRLPTRQIPVFAPDGKVSHYREQKGRRLYTRGQIEAVLRLMQEHDILLSPRIEWTAHKSFAHEVADAWTELAA